MSKSKKCPFCKHGMARLFPGDPKSDREVWYCVNCGFVAEFIKPEKRIEYEFFEGG